MMFMDGHDCTVTVIRALPLAIRYLWMDMYSFCNNGLAPCYKMFMDGHDYKVTVIMALPLAI